MLDEIHGIRPSLGASASVLIRKLSGLAKLEQDLAELLREESEHPRGTQPIRVPLAGGAGAMIDVATKDLIRALRLQITTAVEAIAADVEALQGAQERLEFWDRPMAERTETAAASSVVTKSIPQFINDIGEYRATTMVPRRTHR